MIPDITGPTIFLYYSLIFFIILIIRYFLAAGIFYWFFYKLGFKRWEGRKLNKDIIPSRAQYLKEIKWSIITSVIFALVGVFTIWLYQQNFTVVYTELSFIDILYMPLSLAIALGIHETYYYWIHRWMHHPKIFRQVHKIHHDSIVTSPFTAFSFHPWEGFIEALILPIILMIIPMHPYVIFTYLVLMTISSIINHLDIEVYPDWFYKNRIGKWFIGASHHHFHHREFKTNYGLYFTFWDKWMNTESEKYKKIVK